MMDKMELLNMGDSPIVSQYRALSKAGFDLPPLYTDGQLIEENVWSWILKTIGAGFGGQFKPYPTYDHLDNTGIFPMPEHKQSIAILADWASDTPESRKVAGLVGDDNDYTIHLGDTYFVGSREEIKANCFPDEEGRSVWPYGKSGSFALMGNHEMYSGGESYFQDILPLMGTYGSETDRTARQAQKASFFCLENKYWRIIGLDTGYESLNFPLKLTQNANLDLTPEQKHWLQDIVRLNDDQRGLVFLSHHQCFSAFEAEFSKPQETISTMMNPARDVIWLWGHEHWFSVYGANRMHNGGNVFGRCIGNGVCRWNFTVRGDQTAQKQYAP